MKLATQLSLLLVCAVLAAVVAMGAFFAFNLERGFVGYVNALQERHFDALVQATTQLAERFNGLQPLFRDRPLWMRLLRETEGGTVPGDLSEWLAVPEPLPPEGNAGPEFRGPFDNRPRKGDDRPPIGDERTYKGDDRAYRGDDRPFKGDDRPFKGPRRGRPPPPGEALGIAANRFALLDAKRHSVFAEALLPSGSKPSLKRDIRLEGQVVGYVRHDPFERVSRPEDLAFLRRQLLEGALVGLGVMLLALLAAPWIARRWTRPLREMSAATERIAKGEFAVRTEPRGADEIAALMGNVNAMAKALAAMEAARKRWIAETAHELRTPLMVLRGEIDAMQDGVRKLDERALQSLSEETRHLTKLVNDLHLLAVADMDGLQCSPSRFDPVAMVQRVVERFRPRAKQRGLDLAVSLPREPAVLDADEDRIEQLLGNLLENSLRYTDAPGRVEVSLTADRHGVRLVVEDSAPGVGTAECERLFEPLYRADKARSRREGGSGLGLSIVQAIVRAHRGKISARPSRLGGLEISVLLPAT